MGVSKRNQYATEIDGLDGGRKLQDLMTTKQKIMHLDAILILQFHMQFF